MTSLYNLMMKYGKDCGNAGTTKFLECVTNILNKSIIEKIEKDTREQYKSGLRYELRYGRITASNVFEVCRSKTADVSLVASIMGAMILILKQ
ncbi:hypothetical protein JTB14_016715 [Gonioctena quinquepunctata]|nr:hypothetical protein JTB14_016715 [Gonioctena quinquepunctata]